jgi:hypothetical protein
MKLIPAKKKTGSHAKHPSFGLMAAFAEPLQLSSVKCSTVMQLK